MRKRQALTFPIADIDEIKAAVKTAGDIFRFEETMRGILKRDGRFRGGHNLS